MAGDSLQTFLNWVGAGGLFTGLGAAVGYGTLKQKTDTHADELKKVKEDMNLLIRVDERVERLQDDISEIKTALKTIARS